MLGLAGFASSVGLLLVIGCTSAVIPPRLPAVEEIGSMRVSSGPTENRRQIEVSDKDRIESAREFFRARSEGWHTVWETYPSPEHSVAFVDSAGTVKVVYWIGTDWLGGASLADLPKANGVRSLTAEEVEAFERLISPWLEEAEQRCATPDLRRQPLESPAPAYPVRLAERGIEGWVEMTASLRPDGGIERASVVDSSLSIFEQVAMDAFARWRYCPPSNADVSSTAIRMVMAFELIPQGSPGRPPFFRSDLEFVVTGVELPAVHGFPSDPASTR